MKNLFLHTFAVIACLTSTVVASGIHVSLVKMTNILSNRERYIWDPTYSSQP